MAKIYAPNKDYSGVSATVTFVNGVGETDNEYLKKWFTEKGYEIEETSNGKIEGSEKKLKDMTVPELKEFAVINNIEITEDKKADIIKKIEVVLNGNN